jgi:hypothetical protein
MNPQVLSNVCKQVYRKFPEVDGVLPKVQARPEGNLSLVFSGTAKAADGHLIPRTVRAVVNPDGKILRMTTSK